MPFWILNKQTNEPLICGSIASICANTTLKPDALYTHFGRQKHTKYENDTYRIHKLQIMRGAG